MRLLESGLQKVSHGRDFDMQPNEASQRIPVLWICDLCDTCLIKLLNCWRSLGEKDCMACECSGESETFSMSRDWV